MKKIIVFNHRLQFYGHNAQNSLQFALRQPEEFFGLVFLYFYRR